MVYWSIIGDRRSMFPTFSSAGSCLPACSSGSIKRWGILHFSKRELVLQLLYSVYPGMSGSSEPLARYLHLHVYLYAVSLYLFPLFIFVTQAPFPRMKGFIHWNIAKISQNTFKSIYTEINIIKFIIKGYTSENYKRDTNPLSLEDPQWKILHYLGDIGTLTASE